MNLKEIVVSTAYLPTIEYFAFIAKSEVFFMEDAETYQKQSYDIECGLFVEKLRLRLAYAEHAAAPHAAAHGAH